MKQEIPFIMKYTSRILALLLCIFLSFSFTACSGSAAGEGAAGENAVGGGLSDNGNIDDGKTDSVSGSAQAGLSGNWVLLPRDSYTALSSMSMLDKLNAVFFNAELISFTADGSIGIYDYYGQFSSEGYYSSEKNSITLYYEGSEDTPLLFKQESAGMLSHTSEDGDTYCLARISELIPKTELASPELIGAWEGLVEYEDGVQAQRWVVTRDDATWYTVDADGTVTDEGYIISDASIGSNMILFRDQGYFDITLVDGATGEMESMFFGDYLPVEEVPGGSYTPDYSAIYKKYAGYWQYSSNLRGIEPLCVLIREDGTYAVIDNTDIIRSEGSLKTTKAGAVTLPLDGTQEVTYYPDDEGMLVSEDYDRLIHLNGFRDPASAFLTELKNLMLFNDRATEWYSFTEDAAWLLRDKYGNELDSGTVLVDPDDENTLVLISDSGKYPLILNHDKFVNDGSFDEYGQFNGRLVISAELDDIPSFARFAGLWTFNHPQLSFINILFVPESYYDGEFRLDGMEINADNTVNDERSYEIMQDPGTGVLTFYADNGYSTLVIPVSVSENGELVAADTGESILIPVDPDAYFDSTTGTCVRSNG